MKGNISVISYDCYQQATEKQLEGLKWKENRVYYISGILNEKIQEEIYGYIDDRCRRLSLSTVVNDIYRFDLLKEFLNEKCTNCSSITDKKWEELERSYKAFLYKKGLALCVRRNRPDRRSVEQQSSAQVSFLKMYYEYVVKLKTADIPENEKDVWDMRKLDIVPRSNPIRGRYRLDFREIRQKEFKEIIASIGSAYSFLIFNLLCAPCFAAIGAIRREMNSAKWTWFAIGYQCCFAYAVSLMVYQFWSAIAGSPNVIGLVAASIVLVSMVYMLFIRKYREPKTLTQKVGNA